MKLKTLFILSLGVLLMGCSTDYNPTSAEQDLVGDWGLNKTETYGDGVLSTTVLHTDHVNCHLKLTNTSYGEEWLTAVNGLTCSPGNAQWRIDDPLLNLNGNLYQILSQSSTELVIQYGSMDTGLALKYYLSL